MLILVPPRPSTFAFSSSFTVARMIGFSLWRTHSQVFSKNKISFQSVKQEMKWYCERDRVIRIRRESYTHQYWEENRISLCQETHKRYRTMCTWCNHRTLHWFLLLWIRRSSLFPMTMGENSVSSRMIEYETKMTVFLVHLSHSWEWGSNENTEWLLRQFLPKKTDFTSTREEQLQYYTELMNHRWENAFEGVPPMKFSLKTKVAFDSRVHLLFFDFQEILLWWPYH